MLSNKIFQTGFLCLLSVSLYAQPKGNGSISGVVADLLGRPVPGASIVISGAGTTSDDHGQYAMKALSAGKIKLQVSAVGYASQHHELKIDQGKNLQFDIVLEEISKQLEEVVVEGKSENQVRVEEIKTSGFSTNVIDLKMYSNMTADVNQVIKRTSGILVREQGGVGSNFTFRINGLAGKIYIDDVPMDQYGSSMTLNNIPVNLVDRVEIYKGVVPAHLGSDAMGGAVNIVTKQRTRKFLDISQSYGSFNTHQTAITGGIRDKKTGLKLRASGFYNYSDNDYMMHSYPEYDIELKVTKVDEDGNARSVVIDKARRFHDRYWSAMGEFEVGVEKVKWADWFTVGLTYSQNMKQMQTAATVNEVRGGYWTVNRYLMPTIKYRKENFLVKGLFANLYANYSRSKNINRDTASYDYDWTGNWVPNREEGKFVEKTHIELLDDAFVARANFNYDLDEALNHSLNLNYTFSTTTRHSYDLMKADVETTGLPKRLGKHILGLSWQGQWFDKKMISVASVKYYGMDTRVTLDERPREPGTNKPIGDEFVIRETYFNYPSAALALRYRLTPDWGIKTSVERGYILPEVGALFGDGQLTLPNYDLTPERSDNVNLGSYYNHFFGDHFINLDGSAYYRDSKNYIRSQIVTTGEFANGQYYQNENVPGVLLHGFEAEARYGYKELINFSVNATYERALDSWKYTDSTRSQISGTYKKQISNRPWLYGNTNLTLAKKDLIGKGTRLQLSHMFQYIHWFYMQWGHLGSAASRDFVPTQTTHTVVLTYSWKNDVYNISLEGRNLTDERAYDDFRLQKPGRAFYVKFRISLM